MLGTTGGSDGVGATKESARRAGAAGCWVLEATRESALVVAERGLRGATKKAARLLARIGRGSGRRAGRRGFLVGLPFVVQVRENERAPRREHPLHLAGFGPLAGWLDANAAPLLGESA